MRAEVAEGHYYKALKGARKLLKHEDNIVRAMQGQVED